MRIKHIQAREILDSNGNPTISAEIELWCGTIGRGDVPSGASTGKTEVLEMRDGDMERYNGKGVLKAIDLINNELAKELDDKEFLSQKEFDEYLIKKDGTPLKTKLGGNTILALSMAFCRATAKSIGLELYEYFAMIYFDKQYSQQKLTMPRPLVLVMEGGKHGNWATDIQEYMITPKPNTFNSFEQAFEASTDVFRALHDILRDKGYSTNVGFEGAFAPQELKSNEEAFELIMQGIKQGGHEGKFEIALDVASSEFFKDGKYFLKREKKQLNTEEWINVQKEWYMKYPIFSVEDPIEQEDWDGWSMFRKETKDMYQVVGDDLLTTNVQRIKEGIERGSINSVLIKINQIGTISETLDAIRVTVDNGMSAIVSHRSGETNDDLIADLVVGTPANQCKFGGPDRGERLVKYNRLLEIEKRKR
jgi:enolase